MATRLNRSFDNSAIVEGSLEPSLQELKERLGDNVVPGHQACIVVKRAISGLLREVAGKALSRAPFCDEPRLAGLAAQARQIHSSLNRQVFGTPICAA